MEKKPIKTVKKSPLTMATEEFLVAFRKTLPQLDEGDPFVIMGSRDSVGGTLAMCKCKCSLTSDCGGGGGGS